jgi:beta-lactamase superfamily II metal-dependent hydrolase
VSIHPTLSTRETGVKNSAAETPSIPPHDLEITILDVGHGNCAVIRDRKNVLVVDVGSARTLIAELRRARIQRIEHLALSHADQDHIQGAAELIAHNEFSVGTLWINPDPTKRSETFLDLVTAAADRHNHGMLNVCTALNVGVGEQLNLGRIGVEVLHPTIRYALIGPITGDHPLGPVTSNSMSAVLRITLDGAPAALLPGDLDAKAFRSILDEKIDITAPVLVFPHHGGHAGGNDRSFARDLTAAVKPGLIVFSQGREHFHNPRPDIVAGIRDALGYVPVACTQLSRNCQPGQTPEGTQHLLDRPAIGRVGRSCCAGTVVITRDSDGVTWGPGSTAHSQFIDLLTAPLCRSNSPSA